MDALGKKEISQTHKITMEPDVGLAEADIAQAKEKESFFPVKKCANA